MRTIPFIVPAGSLALAAIALSFAGCAYPYRAGSLAELGAAGKLVLDPPMQSQDPWTPEGNWELEKGVMIHHLSSGKGKSVIVLHGGPGVPADRPWEGLASLEGSYRFIYPQERGSGFSTRTIDRWASADWGKNMAEMESRLGLTAQVADIERTRRLLGLEKLTIIGHSWGGFLALLYAIEFPTRIERLVLVSPATVLRMPPPKEADLYSQVEARLQGEMKRAFQSWKKSFFDYGRMWSMSESDWRSLNEGFMPFFAEASRTTGASWGLDPLPLPAGGIGGWAQPAQFFSLGQGYDLRRLAGRVSCPTWLLRGDRDLIPSSAWKDWSESIPGLRELGFEGSGHFPMRDQRFAELVKKALEE